MKVWAYASYAEYVAAQIEANKRKVQNVWVRPETVAKIAMYVPRTIEKIMCHGTRNAAEQKLFRKFFPLATVVLGTEISDNAAEFPDTVQHDFHEANPKWVGKFDLVYTNALDHAYSPLLALTTWREQLKPTGRLFIEYSFTPENNTSKASDPLELEQFELVALFDEVGLRVFDTFRASGMKGEPSCSSIVFVLERA